MLRLRALSIIAAAFSFMLAASCGRSNQVSAPPNLDQLATPAGVNNSDWEQLKAALSDAIVRYSSQVDPGTPPNTLKSKVQDLHVTVTAGSPTFTWTFLDYGDYDQNGAVTISDLTPLGINLGKHSSDPGWTAAQVADGDRNGEVSISDVTPIGAALGVIMSGYLLQATTTPAVESSWTTVQHTVVADSVLPSGGGPRKFTLTLPDLSAGNFYRVRVYTGDPTANPQLGIASDPITTFINAAPVPTATQGTYPDKVAVSWPALPDATDYQVFRDGSTTMLGDTATTSYDDTTLTDYQNHSYRVKAVYPSATSDYSAPAIGYLSLQGTWWTFGADASRTRRAKQPGPASNEIAWAFRDDASYDQSSPAIAGDGSIFIGSTSATNSGLLSFTPTGDRAWIAPALPVHSSPTIGPTGLIYFGTDDGRVNALHQDGSQLWSYYIGTGVESSPLPDAQGNVYFGCLDNYLYKVDATGNFVWKNSLGGICHGSPVELLNGDIAAGSDHARLESFNSAGFLGLDVQVGKIKGSPAVLPNGDIVTSSDYGSVVVTHPDGSANWSQHLGNFALSSAALATDGAIVVGGADGNLYCLEPGGATRWSYPMSGPVSSSPVIDSNDAIYAADETGKVVSVDSGGNLRWEFQAQGKVTSSLALDAGHLYVADVTGYIYCFGPELPQPPKGVTDLVAEDGVEPSAIKVTWGESYNADSYKVYKDGGATEVATVMAPNTEWTDTPVADTATHTYKVVPTNQYGDGPESQDDGFANGIVAGPGNWNMGGQDPAGTHLADSNGPRSAAGNWSYPTGLKGFMGPVCGAAGELYFEVVNTSNSTGKIVSLTKNGAWRWDYVPPADPTGMPCVADDGTIYFTTSENKLYALNPDGGLAWKAPVTEAAGGPIIYENGQLYYCGYTDTYCLKAADASVVWTNNHGCYNTAPAIGSDGSVYACEQGSNKIYIMNSSGVDKPFYYGGSNTISFSPVIKRDAVNGDRVYYASGKSLFCCDDDDNQIYQFTSVKGYNISSGIAVQADGTAYASFGADLYCVDTSGSQLWMAPNAGGGIPCIDNSGYIYTNGGSVINCTTPGGANQWSLDIGENTQYAWPGLNAGQYYVLTEEGTLHAFLP